MHFSLCWSGGEPPYTSELSGNGQSLLRQDGIDVGEFTGAKTLDLRPGRYDVTVSDGAGNKAEGGFTALAEAEMPSDPRADSDARASAMITAGSQYEYQAYLIIEASKPPSDAGQRLADEICDRTARAEATGALPATELVLSDEFSLSSAAAGTTAPAQVFEYLTEKGAIVAEGLYNYGITQATAFAVVGGAKLYDWTNVSQQSIGLLDYGVTDDLAVGAELPAQISSTSYRYAPAENTPNTTVNSSGWTDPSVVATYRVLRQSEAPATLFVQGSVSPDTFAGGQNIFDIGETAVRQQSRYSLAEVFDATYYGSLVYSQFFPGSPAEHFAFTPVWRYHIGVAAAAPLSERWSVSVGANNAFAYGREETYTQDVPFFSSTGVYSLRSRDVFSLSAAVGFEIIPDKLSVWLNYAHFFDSSYTSTQFGQLQKAINTKTAGENLVGIVLRSQVSLDSIARGIL